MVQGINYITDEKGNETGIILDLVSFKKNNVKASEVINALSKLQQLIDQAGSLSKKSSNWDLAKEKLKDIKPQIHQ